MKCRTEGTAISLAILVSYITHLQPIEMEIQAIVYCITTVVDSILMYFMHIYLYIYNHLYTYMVLSENGGSQVFSYPPYSSPSLHGSVGKICQRFHRFDFLMFRSWGW